MVWYGMVWYGMVWYGMVWYGMVWYGMVWSYLSALFDCMATQPVSLLSLKQLVQLLSGVVHVRVWLFDRLRSLPLAFFEQIGAAQPLFCPLVWLLQILRCLQGLGIFGPYSLST